MTASQCKEIKLAVPWGHVAARAYGRSEGEPVLLVHGREDNAGSFTRLIQYLPVDTFYYVAIDLPGHGWSSHFPSWMMPDYMDYTQALQYILEALKWETCTFIGHSLGGQAGLLYSILQPHRFKKLIIIDAIILVPDPRFSSKVYLENAFALSLKVYSGNVKPQLYTKEEVLHILQFKRLYTLTAEAADTLFERAVTEVNGKYKYNRDIRIKNVSFMPVEKEQVVGKLLVPIYLFIASEGVIHPHRKKMESIVNDVDIYAKVQLINVNGNHDVHNNNPERIAPLIRKILISDHSSKL